MVREPTPAPIVPAQTHKATLLQEQAHPPFSWRLFWLLALLMMLASLLVLPYAMQLLSVGRVEYASFSTAARITLILKTIAQTVLLYWPLALLGLLAARRIGLGVPYLSAITEGRPVPPGWLRMFFQALIAGLGIGFLLLVMTALLAPLITAEQAQLNTSAARRYLPNAWQGLLGSISAGINEEILLRLFLLSALAWLMQRFLQRTGHPAPIILWTANVLAAFVFALLHIPNLTALGVPLSPLLFGSILALNGLAGLAYGRLFWTIGLECAMLAHFFSDFVLHVITVPLQNLVP